MTVPGDQRPAPPATTRSWRDSPLGERRRADGHLPARGEMPAASRVGPASAALYWTRSPIGLLPLRPDWACDRRVGHARGAMALPVGKLRGSFLASLFDKHVMLDERVVVGRRVAEDAAVRDMGDRYLVATTDPITFVTEDLGWYALVVNANDLAVRGAVPRWFLATCLLPEGRTSEADVTTLFAQLGNACRTQGVTLIGGHTEVTSGLDRPIVVGTMLGEVDKPRLVTTGGARPGDALVLTKGVPVEGTSILARVRDTELRARGYDEAWLARARGMVARLSVVPEALL